MAGCQAAAAACPPVYRRTYLPKNPSAPREPSGPSSVCPDRGGVWEWLKSLINRETYSKANAVSGCWLKGLLTTPFTCSTPQGSSRAGMSAGNASRDIPRKRSSASTFPASTPRQTGRTASLPGRSASRANKAVTRRKAGAFARTAPSSGRASSSIRFTKTARWSALPRSPATSLSAATRKSSSMRCRRSSPSRRNSTRWASSPAASPTTSTTS